MKIPTGRELADMQLEAGLLWPGVALLLLLLLGAAAGLCVSCSRPGVKSSEKIYEQRSLQETQQSFAVARTYSLARQVCLGTLGDKACDVEAARTDKLRCFSSSQEDSEAPRYQNFSKGSRLGSEAAYVDPIASEYYNWGCFHKPPEGDEDANSYENVLICSQSPESEQIHRVTPPSPDEDGDPDYVNGDMNMGQA